MNDNPSPESHNPFDALAQEGEARILPPDYALKKLIGEDVDIRQIFTPEHIEKAQSVIEENAQGFLDWVKKDLSELEASYRKLAANPADAAGEMPRLAKAAYVIKSQAGTFGFGLATRIAKSLDDFCTAHMQPTPEQLTVIGKHIETLRAIFDKNISGDGDALGKELTQNLAKLTAKYQ